MRRLFALCLIVALSGCAGPASPSERPSGVFGRSVVDRGCPHLKVGHSCPSHPVVSAVVARIKGSTSEAARVGTDRSGAFRLTLAPGVYQIWGERPAASLNPRSEVLTVTVAPEEFTAVTLRFDSGVRGLQPG